ncbi:response regulator [candidate division KSB1 bacterium]|nr:response regulator [candidate division KSB1 bacterium]
MGSKIQILLIEDDMVDIKIFQRTVRAEGDSFDLIIANTLGKAIEILKEQVVDLIIVDPGLPDSSSSETIKQVITHSAEKPVIILTGSDDEELPLRAIELGAHDYLSKDNIDNHLLKRSIRYALEKNMILSELKKKTKQIKSSEIRFRYLIENSSDSVLIIDKDGIVKFVNKSTEELFGKNQKDFVGTTFDYPIDKDRMSRIKINNNGKTTIRTFQILETEWNAEKAYLVLLRDL